MYKVYNDERFENHKVIYDNSRYIVFSVMKIMGGGEGLNNPIDLMKFSWEKDIITNRIDERLMNIDWEAKDKLLNSLKPAPEFNIYEYLNKI